MTIQSFDWGSLMRMKQVDPRLPLVALDNYDFLEVDQPGASPWLGGIDIDGYDGDPVKAAASFGAWALSPVHGFPHRVCPYCLACAGRDGAGHGVPK